MAEDIERGREGRVLWVGGGIRGAVVDKGRNGHG
jgi:hypothetical protein